MNETIIDFFIQPFCFVLALGLGGCIVFLFISLVRKWLHYD